jgi:hypothetical protein
MCKSKTNTRDSLPKIKKSWVPVDLAYNPSYSGGRDHKDGGSKPDPTLKTTNTKKECRVAQSSRVPDQ